METAKIAVVDDQLLFRKGIISILEHKYKIPVIIEADSGRNLLAQLESLPRPDVVLLDLEMPEMDGKKVLLQVKEKYAAIKVIILSVHYNNDLIAHFVEMGAACYLPKNAEPEELEAAIAAVHKNDFYFTEDTLLALRKAVQNRGKNKNSVMVGSSLLTMREIEILELICREFNTPEIADKLSISPRTVEGHRNNLLSKTGARNTAGLVLFAVKNNIISAYNSPI